MKLIYIAEGIGPVFQSQVVELLNSIVRNNDIFITLMVGIRSDSEKEKVLNLDKRINLKFFKSVPLYPVLDLITRNSLKKQLQKLDITPATIFHTRGEYIGIVFYKIFKTLYSHEPKLLIDVRGAGIEEISNYMKQSVSIKIKIKYLKYLYNKYMKSPLILSAVTQELKKYLVQTYSLAKNDIAVNHCIGGKNFYFDVDTREKIRMDLNIKKDDILFVFSTSSSGGKWQNGDKIASDLVSQGYKVLMLTRKKYNIDGVISCYVPYDDVPKYLMAADIGIIIRNDDIVNRVASPIKFSEYLSCGLPVIANDSVDLISTIIEEHECGLVLKDIENISKEKISLLRKLDREKISTLGHQLFDADIVSQQYMKVYISMEDN